MMDSKPVMPAPTFSGMRGKLDAINLPDRDGWYSHVLPGGWGNPEHSLGVVRVMPSGSGKSVRHVMNATDVGEHGWWEPYGYVADAVPTWRPA